LGVVKLQNYDSYTVADLPGLIEGASEGVGLGDKFLKHAYRCKIILHMVDMSAEEGRNPVEDYRIIRGELEKYSSKLANKKEIVVASKMDNPDFAENLEQFKKAYPKLEIYPISSFTNEGIDELLLGINDALKAEEDNAYYSEEEMEENVYIKFKEEKPYTITREDDLWVIRGKEIEKLFSMTKFEEEEGAMRFGRKLRGMGVEDELARLGAKPGDDVVINDYLFTYKG